MSDKSQFFSNNSSQHAYKSLKSNDPGKEIELTEISTVSIHETESSDDNGGGNSGMSFDSPSGEISE